MKDYEIGEPIDLRKNYFIAKGYHFTPAEKVPHILTEGLVASSSNEPARGRSLYTGRAHKVPPATYFLTDLKKSIESAGNAAYDSRKPQTVLELDLRGIPIRADPELTDEDDLYIYSGYIRVPLPPNRIRVVKTIRPILSDRR